MIVFEKTSIRYSDFSKIREGNYCCADKTQIPAESVDKGSYYFLSHPHRFGRSLFLNTLREAFLVNKDYFKGLYLENNWDWNKKHPVIRIDFGGGQLRGFFELDQKIIEVLTEY